MSYRISARRIAVLLAAAVMAAIPLTSAQAAATGKRPAAAPVSYREEEGTLSFENDHLSVSLDTATGEFQLTHRPSGKAYRSNPEEKNDPAVKGINRFVMYSQLLVTMLDRATHETSQKASYTGSVMREGLAVESIEGGVRLAFTFPENEVTVPLDLVLDGPVLSRPGGQRRHSAGGGLPGGRPRGSPLFRKRHGQGRRLSPHPGRQRRFGGVWDG